MLFIFGRRLLGKCDEVPGLFHVATQFFHINYLPLVPLGTYVVTSQTGNSFRGVPIALNGKSILCAWGRALSLVGIVVAILCGVIELSGGQADSQEKMTLVVAAVVAGMAFWFTWFSRWSRTASYHRAWELGGILKLNRNGFERIDHIFGVDAGANTPIVDARAASTAPDPVLAVESPTRGIGYPCRVCQQSFDVDRVYAEDSGQTICHSCWQSTQRQGR